MTLDREDIIAIADELEHRLKPRVEGMLPGKLSIAQFAWCIERSRDYVEGEIRTNRKFKTFVQGQRPKLIHPSALELYGVDSGLAAARLRQFPGTSKAKSSDKVSPPQS
jgi:hypothetical protein